jgi:hypothetical protein
MPRKSDLASLTDAVEALDELHGRFAGIRGRGEVDAIRRRFRASIRKLNKLGLVNFPPKPRRGKRQVRGRRQASP